MGAAQLQVNETVAALVFLGASWCLCLAFPKEAHVLQEREARSGATHLFSAGNKLFSMVSDGYSLKIIV